MPFGESLYFSFITGLTIGYGDIVVKTPFARLLAVLLGLIGIIFTGIMVAAALRAVERSLEDLNMT
jgi:voltage-gated potassium channel